MNLNNLNSFIRVVEAGSISRVAEESYISQQALSDQIRRLEKHFATSLLERGRPLRPTAAGRLVYEEAKKLLSALDELERKVSRLSRPEGQLVISTGLVWTPPFLPRLVERFRAEVPGAEVKLIHPGVLHERRDAPLPDAELIVGNLPFGPGVESVVIFEDRLSVAAEESLLRGVLGPDWESRFQRMGAEELAALGLAEELEQRHRETDVAFSAAGDSMDMMAYRCRTGQTAVLIPEKFAREAFAWERGIHITPLGGTENEFRVGVGFRRGAALSEGAVRFVEAARGFTY